MKRHILFTFAVCALCCALLAGCTAYVRLGGERFPRNSEAVTAVLKDGELDKLDKFTALESADLTGSDCFAEILAWAQAHPDVAVSYSVTFPDGTVLGTSDKSADLSQLVSADVPQAKELIAYLPALETVKLGDISLEDYALLSGAYPGISFDYSVSLLGKSVSTLADKLELACITDADVPGLLALLPYMDGLRSVDLGDENSSKLSWESIAALQKARADVDFSYGFTLFGKSFTTLDATMDLNHISMDDEGAAVREVLPCMTRLTYLDMDLCGVSNEAMADIRDEYPDVEVVWRIWFGLCYSVRTDAIKILASKPSVGGKLNSADVEVLKYCTKMKYIDLGHNGDGGGGITDISFVSYMPDLEVFIIAMNDVTDISPLANCPKLEYLEIFSTPISDISVLKNATELKHLMIHHMPNLTDISALYGLTKLERLWLDWHTPIPQEQLDKLHECVPGCEINTEDSNRWKYVGMNEVTWEMILQPRYKLLCEQFGYLTLDYSFYWLDPKY